MDFWLNVLYHVNSFLTGKTVSDQKMEHYHKRKAQTDNGKSSQNVCECGSFLTESGICPSCY